MAEQLKFSTNKIDILKKVYSKKLTNDAAEHLFEDYFEAYHKHIFPTCPNEYFCLTMREYTAIAVHGLSFNAVAQWRYEGWPIVCEVCKQALDVTQEGWGGVVELEQNGQTKKDVLIHWDCNNKI